MRTWAGMSEADIIEETRLDAVDREIKAINKKVRELKKNGYKFCTVKKELRLFSPEGVLLCSGMSFCYYDTVRKFLDHLGINLI